MLEDLRQRVQNKNILILGVGNQMRADDGVGPLMIKRLQGKVHVPLLDAGDVPENYLGPIERAHADLVLVIDAADLGAHPGDLSLLGRDQLSEIGLSTHSSNLSLVFEALPANSRPEVLLLVVQPESTEFGGEPSPAVMTTMDILEGLLTELFSK
jgi:hydrogenase 3 maturation protease